MFKKMILLFFTMLTMTHAESIEFTFGNQTNSGTFYEFDIMVQGESGDTRLGDALVYLNYSTAGFGTNVLTNGNIEVTKTGILDGELVEGSGFELYEIVNILDNSEGCVAITIGYLYDNSPGSANQLTTLPESPQPMLNIKLTIANTSAHAGLSFSNPDLPAQPTMLGQQYLSDNTTKYDPVYASDTDDSALDPIAVHLVSFTASPAQEGVLLEWQTANEINHAGFHLHRSKNDETDYHKINSSLIPAKANGLTDGATYHYEDQPLESATFYYKLEAVNLDGKSSFYPAIKIDFNTLVASGSPAPTEFTLKQNYPNPFNPATQIHYQIPDESYVDIAVYNISGQKIKSLVVEHKVPGYYTITWDGLDSSGQPVTSGIYVLRMQADDFSMNRRITLLR